MPDTTQTAPAAATLRECAICESKLIGGTAVALVERGTAPARILFACTPCLRRHNLLPLDEQQQPYSDGRLQFRDQPVPLPHPERDIHTCL